MSGTHLDLRSVRLWFVIVTLGVVAAGCLVTPDETGTGGHGGAGSTGTGNHGQAGTNGASGTLGSAGTTGTAGTLGSAGTNGDPGRGGTTGTSGTGGTTAGNPGSAGSSGMAGTTGRAGTTGTSGTGGNAGTNGRGGTSGTGGAGTTGAAGTGPAAPTACTIGPASNGSGSFTYYWFGQGSGRDGSGYRTACGYYGTENGQTDTIENIASMSPANATYFAAIPGTNGFNTSGYCGACVQITGQNGKQIIATVADECPYGGDGNNSACQGNPNGHLDLSKAAFDQLGYSVGNPKNTTWKFVPCPVTGNVKIRIKNGNANEIYIENAITAISSVMINGQQANRTSYGAWHVGGNIPAGATIDMTDKAGRTLSVTLGGTSMGQNQDSGRQFPGCL
jgi:expansin (peptidoglycan-binding protein)